MLTFNEYYQARIQENWIMDLADKFLSKYKMGDYGLRGTRPSGPTSPTGRFPLQQQPGFQARTNGPESVEDGDLGKVKWNPALDSDSPNSEADPMSNWNVNWRNVVDNPEPIDDELRKLVYKRIEEIISDNDNPVRQPAEVFAILNQDPGIQNYLSRVNRSQRGAFTRRANSAFANKTKPLQVHYGDPADQSPHRTVSSMFKTVR